MENKGKGFCEWKSSHQPMNLVNIRTKKEKYIVITKSASLILQETIWDFAALYWSFLVTCSVLNFQIEMSVIVALTYVYAKHRPILCR